MSKRDKPVKKRKRTNWKQVAQERIVRFCQLGNELSVLRAELRAYEGANDECNAQANRLRGKLQDVLSELTRYRLICDWACQRIEKLETQAQTQQREKRILLDTLFEVQAENIMQGEDILRQRDELIKLRGEPAERISL